MKTKYMGLIFVLCMVLARPVQAYYGGALEVGSESTQFCPCDIISSDEITVKITNYGSSSDTYYMSLELPDGWSGFILPQLTLGADETAVVDPVWITAACGTSPGIYTVTVAAKSGMSGKKYTKDLELEVMACHDLSISSESYLVTCENEAMATELEISNLGKMDETFILYASPAWVMLSDDSVSVEAGQKETVSLSIAPPAGLTGIQNITIHAESDTSYARADTVIRMSIEPCYTFDAKLSPPADAVCIGSSAGYYLNIDNVGTKPDTYRLVTPNWIAAEHETVSVGSHERESVRITATPPARREMEVVVSVSSLNHPTAVVDAVSMISALDCRSVAVSISPAERNICRGESTDFVVRVENTGTVLTPYEVTASMGTLGRKKLVLGPGEAQNVILDISSTAKVGSYPVSILVYDGNVSDEDSATLNIQNCYDADFDASPVETSACKGDTLTYEIGVKNTGELPDEYTLKYLGKQLVFELEPGESKSLEAKIAVNYFWESENEILFALQSSHGVHAEKSVTVGVGKKERCYSVDLSIINGNETKEKETSVVVCNAVTVKLKIVNKGLRSDHYSIIVDGPDWAHISHDSFYLTPLQEEEFYLYLSPPYETPEKGYKVTILADSEKALSGVEIDAVVLTEPAGEANITLNETGNVTGNYTQIRPAGLTGLFLAFEGVPIGAISIAVMAAAAAFILLLRFAIFR